MVLPRKHLLKVDSYQAGKPIEEIKRQLRLKDVIKLASNENPLGPSPKALEAVRKALSSLNRYPDSNSYFLKRKLAKFYGLEPSNISVGNGSDELIDIIIRAFVDEGECIITSEAAFLEYKIMSSLNCRPLITVPLKYFKFDLDEIKKRITQKTKVVFIANPNNPTGTYVTKYELEEFLKGIPEGVLVVLDEAYDAFIDVDDFPKSLNYIKRKNVLVLKTCSKSYGLAGLRLGYCLGSPELISYLERARQPFNVNSLAQVAAIAALDDKKFLARTKALIADGKSFLYKNLAQMGIPYVASVANFILIDTGRDGFVLFKEMLKFGVIVRDMRQYGLKNFIRVSIGTKKENIRFIKVLKKVIRFR
ncbi:MAG: histidinol-phosphate transaminase [Candidatus Omnitrophica bacterium]|jgi:histidinol-phosphate aminotransferase|nr:histidinol-phosphate transaminase [Candidatus Omnitrophota bacterium]MDD3987487.1 histidinol-phosphate transaminase [Candidatus Omnitrophota bacterium]MDD4982059.1 histidinol-phosphate transaminase [Candidatus Omnitrophota bacterium]MDD5665199.1 histidinol-phosphate transaminase [Candidatus Omnitrophota bacterium]